MGDSGVGKTCLLVRFKDGAFLAGTFISTVGIDFRVRMEADVLSTEPTQPCPAPPPCTVHKFSQYTWVVFSLSPGVRPGWDTQGQGG